MKKRQEALIRAIASNDASAARGILEADPGLLRVRDPEGRTPILLSLYFGHEGLARSLQEQAEEVDLFEAAALGDLATLQRHLSTSPQGANAVAPDGFGPLALAVYFGRQEAAEALLDSGADPNTQASNASRVRPIHSAAAQRDANRSLRLCRLLLERGADPNVAQAGGWTPLHQAAAHGRRELVELLLEHGAAPDVRSEDDRTPREMAESKGHHGLLPLLDRASP